MDIFELLSEREIGHPTRAVSASISDGELRLVIEGYPWWRDVTTGAEARIMMRFVRITSGDLNLPGLLAPDDDKVLEDFDVRLTSELEWAQPERFKIFCSAPLANPISVFTAVQDFLLTSNAIRTPGDFLNGGESLRRFIEVTSSHGYLLARGPECIRRIVSEHLQEQAVAHTTLNSSGYPEGRLFVRLAGSAFFCEAATADFQ